MDGWTGTEPAAGQYGSGGFSTTSSVNGVSDLVRNPMDVKGCPSHRDQGSIAVGKGAGCTSPLQSHP